jgi:hypothetical protein
VCLIQLQQQAVACVPHSAPAASYCMCASFSAGCWLLNDTTPVTVLCIVEISYFELTRRRKINVCYFRVLSRHLQAVVREVGLEVNAEKNNAYLGLMIRTSEKIII